MKYTIRPYRPLSALLLLLAAVGCTNSNDTLTHCNLTAPQTSYSIPTIIAIEKGFFTANHLEIRLNYVKTGKLAMDDLLGGKADFANIVETNIAFAGYQNPPIEVLTNIEKVYDAAIVARRDKGITRPEDLRGKKIGIMLATTSQIYADRLLRAGNIAKDSVTMVNLLPPAMQSALIEGSGVDAVSCWQPYIYNIRKVLGDKAVTFADKTIYTGYMTLAGSRKFIEANPGAVTSLLKAYIQAETFIHDNPAESKAIIARVLSLDASVVEAIWDEYEIHIALTGDLRDAVKEEGQWVQTSQKDFAGKTLPNYTTLFNPAPLQQIDTARVKW